MRSTNARGHPARAFTLLELMVALTMGLLVTSASLGVLVAALQTQREGAIRSSLERDAQLAMDHVARDLAYLGAGVPRGKQRVKDPLSDRSLPAPGAASDPDRQLRPLIRVGLADNLVFLGDLPYPNADLNGVAQLTYLHPDPSRDKVGLASELSTCTPPDVAPATNAYTCRSTRASLIPVEATARDCDKNHTAVSTCPWGLHKWQASGGAVPLVISDAAGGWYQRRWAPGTTSAQGDRTLLHLTHDFPDFGAGVPTHALPFDAFVARGYGGGAVATLDRVFYSLEEADGTYPCTSGECTLRRRQCWGGVGDPGDEFFPRVKIQPMTSANEPTDCDPATGQGTEWESLMDGIESLRFRYFLDPSVEHAPPLTMETSAKTRLLEVELVMRRRAGKQRFRHRLVRRFYLDNWGGLVGETPANGGCAGTPYPPCQ